jgi:hypothetical protein
MNRTANPFDSTIPIRTSARRSLLRRAGSWLCLAFFTIAGGASAVAQQYANVGCTVTIENRSTQVDSDGTWSIPNVPIIYGQYQVHIVCPQTDGTLLDAYSPYVNLNNNANAAIPLLPLSVPSALPQGLSLTVSAGSLSAAGSQMQLSTIQVFSDGTGTDATLGSEGTTYFSSNTAVATVSADGLVTAVGPGSLTITANNNGLVATLQVGSFASLDSDGDGMPDAWEIANGLNPYDPTDAALDPDNDGLTNLQEYQLGTNPHVADTDGDGLTDGQEVKLGTNPLVADTDGDGLSDGQEVALGTNPLLADTDGDGIPDGIEVKIGTNPLVPDVTTTVTGYVTNADGTPSVGTSTVVLTYFNSLTDSTGKFTIPTVPITLGSLIATAEAVINTKVYSGSTQAITPVGNGVTNVGTIVLGQNGGQVSGTVITPDSKPDAGVKVVVTGGADTRTAVTDSNGLYSVSGLQAGQVFVAAIDPTTSLRGQATGALSGSAPLTLNIQLASFGTVSGNVTDVSGNPVPAGVTVTISGVLNATTVADGVGHYAFSFVPLGAVTVDATDTKGNHGRTAATVTATAQTITANVQYLGQGTVTGVVSDGLGNPAAGASVMLYNNGTLQQRLTATTNSVGQYSFSNVFIGSLNLTAQSAQSSTTGNANATILTNGQTVTANIALQPAAPLTGTIYRADGTTPVAAATVSLSSSALTATTDANGVYSFPSVPLGTYNVVAHDSASPDSGQTTVKLATAGQTVTLNVNLVGLGTLTVTVVDGGSNPVSGAATQVNSGGPFNQLLTGVTSSTGTVTFNQVLAVSNLQLSATSPTTGLSGRVTTALTANQTLPVTVTLQSAGTVQGTVFQIDGQTPVAGVTVSILGGPIGGTQTLTAANGTYSFAGVPSGTFGVGVYDSVSNQLSVTNNVTLSTQGQVLTENFIIVGRGTVAGNVTFSNGAVAPGIAVQVTSSSPNDGNPYGTATDINGNYSIANVPIGPYAVQAQQHTLTANSYGTAAGSLPSNGATAVTNVVLSSTLVPSAVTYNDANGFQYSVRENGGIFDGSFNVFVGDGAKNQGASLLSLVQNGQATPFTGEDLAPTDLNGREISYSQSGLDGLTVTRRVYVPVDGYFARYLELLSNPGATPVTVDVQLTTNFGLAATVVIANNTYIVSADVPQIVTTSSGDQVLNINDPQNPDHWVTLGGFTDRDPFLPDAGHFDYIPTIADVFDGPGSPLTPTSAVYNNNLSSTNSQLTETYGSLTVPAGATIGILHFVSQENLFESAAAAATRLVQLPPEALVGLNSSDLSTVMNFQVPAGGVSALSALPTITNQVTGTVFASDGATPVPNAPVYFTSADPIYARFYEVTAANDGTFNFQGTLGGTPVPYANFTLNAWDPTNVTPSTATCRQAGLFYGAGCAIISPNTIGGFVNGVTTTSANITFSNTGVITGTVSRGPTVLNAAGNVTLTGGGMLSVTVPIKADGTYTFVDVFPGTYNLQATVTNTLLTGLTSTTVQANQTVTANITIIQAGNIVGSVTRPDNSLAIGDIVNLRVPGQSPLTTVVDTSGHYAFTDVPIGSAEVDVYDALTNTAASATATISNGVTFTQNLALQSQGTIAGVVSANDGSSVSGLTVTLTSTTSTGNQSLSTTTNNSGAFTFTNVMPGTIVLRATNAEGLQGTSTGSLPVAGQTVTLNIALIAAGNLQGTVFQGDGVTPASGVQVTLSPAPLTGSATTTTNASGQYSYSNVPVGPFTVTATNTANGDQGSAFGQIQTINQQRTLNVTLNGFGNLTVTVLSPSGTPVPDASVTVTTYAIGSTRNGSTNASGIAQFNNVFAGPFNVTAKDPVSGLNTQNSGTITYNQTSTITLTLQALGTIQGTVFAPDGVTPQAGATVSITGPAYKSTTSASDGTYQFAGIPTGYYSITAQDTNGRTRASVNSIQLQGSGSTLTQNLTFIGVGTVSGTVLNTDGSVAENVSLTLTSQNTSFGGSQSTQTAGDGTYSYAEVPIGKVTVAVNYLPTGEIGYATGTITTGQNTVINIQIQGNAITLPTTLTDADGFPYIIAADGTFSGNGIYGGLTPFNVAQPLSITVAGTQQNFGSGTGAGAIQTLSGQQLELTAPVNGLTVTRKIYVPTSGYFARRLDVLANPTSSPITATVAVGAYGDERYEKNAQPVIVTSSNGTTNLNASTLWAVDDDDTGNRPYPMTAPAIGYIFQGAAAPTGLSSILYSSQAYVEGYGNGQYVLNVLSTNLSYQTVTVPANGQVAFLSFTTQEATQGTATTAAQRLVQLPPEALSGLTTSDLASIVNFVVPSNQTLPAIAPPLGGTLSGQVVAGDGVTVVPNATVYVQSTDLQYGGGAKTTADAGGNYSIPSFVADTYSAEAIDPATTITSAVTTGAFPVGATAQTQNIPFTGTGIMRGQLQTTGQTPIYNGSIYVNFYCTGHIYCGGTSTNTGSAGTWNFLTVPAGSADVTASVYTSAAGGFYIYQNGITIPPNVSTYVTIPVPATGTVSGVVTNADGTPAPGATVTTTPASTGFYETTTTAADGSYSFTGLALDTYTITATDPTTTTSVSKSTPVTQDNTSNVNLQFVGKGTVTINAHYANGNIALNTSIYLYTGSDLTYNNPYASCTRDPLGYCTFAAVNTDSNGNVTIPNVPDGAFTIHAYYPGYNFYSTTTAMMTGNGQTVPLAVTLTPVGTISGTLTYANGTPVTSSYVTIVDASGQYQSNALTDSAGNYARFPVPADRTVKVYADSYSVVPNRDVQAVATNQQVPGDGQTLTVNLRFPGTVTVAVSLFNADGTPYTSNTSGGVSIYLNSSDGAQKYGASFYGNPVTFTNVTEAQLVAFAINYNNSYFSVGSTTFTLGPADDGTTRQVNITAAPTGTVEGTVFAADGTTVIQSGYNISLVDVTTANTNTAGVSFPPGYIFNQVSNGAGGFTLTPSFYVSGTGWVNYTALAASGSITTQGQTITQNFTLPLSVVSGTVYLNDGVTPAPNVDVSALQTINGSTNYFDTTSDANGNYQIISAQSGPLVITATDANGINGSITINVPSSTSAIAAQNIDLGPTGTVMGTVYDTNSNPVPNAQVDISSTSNNRSVDIYVNTDNNGNYQSADVATGNVTVTATLPDDSTETANGVINNNGDTVIINVGTPPTPVGGEIFGTVYDGNQDPAPGAVVTATAQSTNTNYTATTDDNGMYTLNALPLDTYSVTAILSDGVTNAGTTVGTLADINTPVEIDIGLQDFGNVSGVITDVNGNPFPNVNLNLQSSADNFSWGSSTDDSGNYYFGSIDAGTITLQVLDGDNNVIGTGTAVLPYGGNVVINVQTTTSSSQLSAPPRPNAVATPGVTLATLHQPMTATQRATSLQRVTHVTSLDKQAAHRTQISTHHTGKTSSPAQIAHLQPTSHISAPNTHPQGDAR